MMWAGTPIFAFLFVAAEPVIVLVLGRQWRDATPIFQILSFSSLAQLVSGSIMWVLVSRGHSARYLKLLLVVSPIMVGSFAVGLPFGVKGVAWAGSLALVCTMPWMLRFAFHGTNLTLRRLGQAVRFPISVCLAGICVTEFGLHMIAPRHVFSQLSVSFLGFALTYTISATIRPIREEIMSFRELFGELRQTMR
jgi:PST family polysaccharide transporter